MLITCDLELWGPQNHHGIFLGLIFGPGIFWGSAGRPRDFFWFWTGNGQRGMGDGGRGKANGERETRKGTRGKGNEERETGKWKRRKGHGERETINGERGTRKGRQGTVYSSLQWTMYSGNPPDNLKWRAMKKNSEQVLPLNTWVYSREMCPQMANTLP